MAVHESDDLVGIAPGGAILLGDEVSCDGFLESARFRVQTHVHDDHMRKFESSKGCQTIISTPATKDLLIAEFDADIPIRSNFIGLPPREPTRVRGSGVSIELVPTQHMLGAAQVIVTTKDGQRLSYSGDFNWPLDYVGEADVLVVDSTYGSPSSRRSYDAGEATERLIELVVDRIREGPIHIKAHPGTLERAIEALDGALDRPFIASPRLCREIEVYKAHGYAIGEVLSPDADAAKRAQSDGQYVRFYGKGDGDVFGITHGTSITLSAYMTPRADPLLQFSSRAFRVALSGHADFDGTMAFIEATGAKRVLTDNSKGGHAVELAMEVRRMLGVDAHPVSCERSLSWGT